MPPEMVERALRKFGGERCPYISGCTVFMVASDEQLRAFCFQAYTSCETFGIITASKEALKDIFNAGRSQLGGDYFN
ncbi:MAG: hypothetical protein ACE5ES_03715 [Candidatus Nanoarchaeia archaeon]